MKTKSEYYEGIKCLAQEIVEECLQYGSDLRDMIHETVDSDQWVIYNHYHAKVREFTDNHDAYLGVYGESDLGQLVQEGGIERLEQTIVYFAMEQDIWDAVSEMKDDLEARLEEFESKFDNDDLSNMSELPSEIENIQRLLGGM